jgi:hypothetical protein
MAEGKAGDFEARALDWLGRNWKLVTFVCWLGFCAWMIFDRWTQIRSFALPDTDDNMRIMQVRALLHGQGWYDLRQYRLNPPFGANIHWSRLVDLPIAGLILALRPFLGGAAAERWAVAIAPMLPFLLLLFSLALTARRLLGPTAYILAFTALFFAGSNNGMFTPERIDHHGWQLALLSISIAALADRKRIRGGVTLGVSTALSLAIGLEMIIYLAIAGAAVALFWVADGRERNRAAAYAVSLGGGIAFSFLVFASYANRLYVCDALSPVWLSSLLVASALLLALAWATPAEWKVRLALAIGAGVVVVAFHALLWPQCLTRLEGVSPEVQYLWLSHVREARPVYMHGWQFATLILSVPVTGSLGWALLAWRNRVDADLFRRTLACAVPGIAAMLLLFWQTRTGPAAQLMTAVGAVAIIWVLVPVLDRARNVLVRTLGVIAIALIGFGVVIPLAMQLVPGKKMSPREIQVERANRMCNFIGSYHPIALEPKGVVFTWVDLAPRLITVTHHDSIMGPYHRNGEQIADSMKAFRGSAEQARQIFAKYHSDYLLSCPDSSTTTIFMSEAPKGFYAQLARGQVPKWLTPVKLPANSPFKMWKISH